jgi:tetratricopeptide (TPR) repeat protein
MDGVRGHARLLTSDQYPLVGRRRELARLTAATEGAGTGRARVVGVCGEAGIGKTRLLEEFAVEAERRGAVVLVGRCYETADVPALWPWSQVLEGLLQRRAARALRVDPRPYAASIGEMLPELRPRLEVVDKVWHLKPERARFRGFDSINRLLRAAARSRPLVIVLDDVHAADAASLDLLEFCARGSGEDRRLLVASFRDVDVEDGSPLAHLLTVLPGTGRYEEIRLGALESPDAALLVERTAGTAVSPEMLRRTIERTEGNPLFLIELTRNLLEGAPPGGSAPEGTATEHIPYGVRETIARRLGRLSPACRGALGAAAALARAFAVMELEHVLGADRREVLVWLDEARAKRIVVELPEEIGGYRFSHGLIRECLYTGLPAGARAELHFRIGSALERVHAGELERHLPEIADHFYRGALAGGAEKALDYAVAAGRAAAARHAYEEAVAHYGRAVAAWRYVADGDDVKRCDLLIHMASAEQYAGNRQRASERFREAVAAARRLRDGGEVRAHELLARAAFGLAHWGTFGVLDTEMTSLLEEALAGLDGDSPLRARLLTRTAAAYYWSGAAEHRERLSAEAVGMARRVGDDQTLAYALAGRHLAIWTPDRIEEQLALAEEALREGERRRDSELQLAGLYWRFLDLLELGDTDAARRDLRRYARIAERLRHPYFRWNAAVPEATFTMLAGRLDEGERLALEALELGRSMFSTNAQQCFGIQMLMLGRLRGSEEALVEPVREFVDAAPGIPAWRGALASLYATLGRERDAAREVERLAPRGLVDLPRDSNLLVGCAFLAEACTVLGERKLARTLYDLMLPYAGRGIVVANCAAHFGVVSHYLGLLAATRGHAERAEEWFADALTRYESMGAAPLVARALLDRAAAALGPQGAGSTGAGGERVRDMVERAAALARGVGMRRAVETAERLRAPAAGSGGPPPEAAENGGAVFRRDGDYWTLAHGGLVARIRDAKGFGYLAELLRAPGRDFHVLDLAGRRSTPDTPGARRERAAGLRLGTSTMGPLLDGRAKGEYRQRIGELEAELAEAEAAHDLGRAEKSRAELDLLGQQLASAVGLGGRDRPAGDAAERARLNVTRAIHAAIRRIRVAHPRMAQHLATSIVTGRLCRYEPDRKSGIDWRF